MSAPRPIVPHRLTAFILCGGASTRLGTDKARARLGPATLIEHALATGRAVAADVALVADDPDRYADLSVTAYRDIHEGQGPLGALHTVLDRCATAWAFVLACDMPFVTPELVRHLSERARRGDAQAVIPEDRGGRLQPLCALYSRACREPVRRLMSAGTRAARALREAVDAPVVPFSEIRDLAHSDTFFLDVDTPRDLERAREIWARRNP